MTLCRTCLFSADMPLWLIPASLPEGLRRITLDASGRCNVCTAFDAALDVSALDDEVEQLEFHVGVSRAPALVALSGGKDSLATLWWATQELALPVVAVLYDNGFIPSATLARAAEACARTGATLRVCRADDAERDGFAREVANVTTASPSPCLRCAHHITLALGGASDALGSSVILSGTNYFAHWGQRPSSVHSTLSPAGRRLTVMHLPFALRRTEEDTRAALDALGLHPEQLVGLSSNCRVPGLVQDRIAGTLGHVPEQEDLALEVICGHRSRDSALLALSQHAPAHAGLLRLQGTVR